MIKSALCRVCSRIHNRPMHCGAGAGTFVSEAQGGDFPTMPWGCLPPHTLLHLNECSLSTQQAGLHRVFRAKTIYYLVLADTEGCGFFPLTFISRLQGPLTKPS